jgi:hypothetical protein
MERGGRRRRRMRGRGRRQRRRRRSRRRLKAAAFVIVLCKHSNMCSENAAIQSTCSPFTHYSLF